MIASDPHARWTEQGRKLLYEAAGAVPRTARQIQIAILKLMESGRNIVGGIASLFARGRMTLGTWATKTLGSLIPIYYGATLARFPEPTRNDIRNLDAAVAVHARYLGRFRDEIGDGKVRTLDPETGEPAPGFLNRARLYPMAAWSIAFGVERQHQIRAGYRLERRLLNAKRHCDGCRREAAKGWVKIGTLLPLGATICQNFCRCTFSYAK